MSDKFKTGYTFDIQTGELIGQETVWLEIRTGEYPHANNVTFVKPPADIGEHRAAVFDIKTQAWKLVEDYRGMPWFEPDGSLGGFIEQIGETNKILQEPPEAKARIIRAWDNEKKEWTQAPEEGWLIEDGEVRQMTPAERVLAGIDELPADMKIENGEVVGKTMDELFAEGKITVAEYNEHQRMMREAAYQATTDKIGLMVLRGEATMEEWQAAIQAVKEQYPYKEEK